MDLSVSCSHHGMLTLPAFEVAYGIRVTKLLTRSRSVVLSKDLHLILGKNKVQESTQLIQILTLGHVAQTQSRSRSLFQFSCSLPHNPVGAHSLQNHKLSAASGRHPSGTFWCLRLLLTSSPSLRRRLGYGRRTSSLRDTTCSFGLAPAPPSTSTS